LLVKVTAAIHLGLAKVSGRIHFRKHRRTPSGRQYNLCRRKRNLSGMPSQVADQEKAIKTRKWTGGIRPWNATTTTRFRSPEEEIEAQGSSA